jgi:hypothetical protein
MKGHVVHYTEYFRFIKTYYEPDLLFILFQTSISCKFFTSNYVKLH